MRPFPAVYPLIARPAVAGHASRIRRQLYLNCHKGVDSRRDLALRNAEKALAAACPQLPAARVAETDLRTSVAMVIVAGVTDSIFTA